MEKGVNSQVKILLVEKKRSDSPTFSLGLIDKGFEVHHVENGKTALETVHQNRPHVIIVNAPSIRSSGERICQSLKKTTQSIPLILIVATKTTDRLISGADVVLPLPFTLQKLLNRLRPLIPSSPKNILKTGNLELDIDNRIVHCGDKQIALTPRLVVLLKFLMEHSGEVVERKMLFTQVWNTDYTDDMRTLDVHINWLRQALEDVPRRPRYIKTIRGVGYRLDVS